MNNPVETPKTNLLIMAKQMLKEKGIAKRPSPHSIKAFICGYEVGGDKSLIEKHEQELAVLREEARIAEQRAEKFASIAAKYRDRADRALKDLASSVDRRVSLEADLQNLQAVYKSERDSLQSRISGQNKLLREVAAERDVYSDLSVDRNKSLTKVYWVLTGSWALFGVAFLLWVVYG